MSLKGARIAFVLPSIGVGGAEKQAYLLAQHLMQREEANVLLVSLSRHARRSDVCDAAGLPYSFFDLRHRYRSRIGHVYDIARFATFLRRSKTDILLPYCMFQNILCALTWRAGGARVCIWNQRDEGRSRLERWIERTAVSQTRCFVSNSMHGRDFIINALKADPGRVFLVHNGVEVPGPRADGIPWRERLGIPAGAFTACMVANLHRKKDHQTLLRAWHYAVDQLETMLERPHLVLAGSFQDSEYHRQLVELARELRIAPYVHFVGDVLDVPDLLREMDIAVFSSVAEGVPNAVLEAMAHGLAVVATDYPGIREALGEAGTLLARPADPRDFADKIAIAAANPALRRQLGEAGRRRAGASFSVERMTSTMVSIIDSEWNRGHLPGPVWRTHES